MPLSAAWVLASVTAPEMVPPCPGVVKGPKSKPVRVELSRAETS